MTYGEFELLRNERERLIANFRAIEVLLSAHNPKRRLACPACGKKTYHTLMGIWGSRLKCHHCGEWREAAEYVAPLFPSDVRHD